MRSLVTAMMLTALTIVVFATFGVAAADPSPPVADQAALAELCLEHHAAMDAMPASMAEGSWMSGSDGHMEMMGGGSMMDGWTGDQPGMDGMHGQHHRAPSGTDQ